LTPPRTPPYQRLLHDDDVVYDRATKGALALSWRLR